MNAYNYFVYQIGELVVGVALLAFFVWLATVSNVFRVFAQAVYLFMWLAMTTLAPLWVAFFIHFPRGHYIYGVLTIALGIILYIPWHSIGYPGNQGFDAPIKEGLKPA